MKDNPGESSLLYFCLHKLHWEPSKYYGLSRREKAVILVLIKERIENEKKQKAKIKKGKKRGR